MDDIQYMHSEIPQSAYSFESPEKFKKKKKSHQGVWRAMEFMNASEMAVRHNCSRLVKPLRIRKGAVWTQRQ